MLDPLQIKYSRKGNENFFGSLQLVFFNTFDPCLTSRNPKFALYFGRFSHDLRYSRRGYCFVNPCTVSYSAPRCNYILGGLISCGFVYPKL